MRIKLNFLDINNFTASPNYFCKKCMMTRKENYFIIRLYITNYI